MSMKEMQNVDYLTSVLYLATVLKRKNAKTKIPVNAIIKFLVSDPVVFIFDNKIYTEFLKFIRRCLKTRFGLEFQKLMTKLLKNI